MDRELPTPPADVKALIERLRQDGCVDRALCKEAADALERTGWRPPREQIARALVKADGKDPDELVSCLVPNPSGHGKRFSEQPAWYVKLKYADRILALTPEAE